MSVRFPSGAATTCSSDFWEEEEEEKKKEEKVPQLPWAVRGKSAVIDGRGHGG